MTDSPLSFDRLENDLGITCDGYRRCTRQAVFIVHIHSIDNCKNHGQLDANGDTIFLMCPACTAAASWRIGEMIGELYAEIPDHVEGDAERACLTCGRRILETHDIFSVERLADGRMHQM